MPTSPAGPCKTPGCPGRAVAYGRCAEHARTYGAELRRRYPDTRPSSEARGYGADWRKVRAAVLATQPWCVLCTRAGRQTKATDVDHIISRAQGGTDDLSNLRGLCASCHSHKTATIDGGNWAGRRA